MLNKSTNIRVVRQKNGWYKLIHHEAWEILTKTFKIGDKAVTVYLDDWSISPIGLYEMDLENAVITDDWLDVFQNPIVSIEARASSVTTLKDYLPSHVYEEVEKMYSVWGDC